MLQPARLSSLIRCFVGSLLLVAAGMKLSGLNVAPYAQFGWLASANVQLIAVEWEILLGLWLWSGWYRFGSWIATVSTFIAFAGVSVYLGIIGQASCGCFGAINASPWMAFAIDFAALALLFIGRPATASLRQLGTLDRRQAIRVHLQLASATGVALVAVYVLANFLYGTPAAALARLRGEIISISPSHVDFGDGEPSTAIGSNVQVTNWSDRPIRLIGGTRDCNCNLTIGLPATILPRTSMSIPILLKTPQTAPGEFTREAEFWTDHDSARKIHLTLGCRVRARENSSKTFAEEK